MAEEIKRATIVVPRAVLISIILNGILGFAMLMAYLFCLGDLNAALESQATLGFPFLHVFWTGTGSNTGAAVMGLIIVILGVCSTVGVLASSSRMLWSFARDKGVPLWRYFIKVRQHQFIKISIILHTNPQRTSWTVEPQSQSIQSALQPSYLFFFHSSFLVRASHSTTL